MKWIGHFHWQTTQHTQGLKQLLFIDGYGFHRTYEFYSFYDQNNIILFCLPVVSLASGQLDWRRVKELQYR